MSGGEQKTEKVSCTGKRKYNMNEKSDYSSTPLNFPSDGESFEILNPCTDFGFKRAFTNPSISIDFLNHVMNYQDEKKIIELSYMDKELQSVDPLGRDFKIGIICKTLGNSFFLIEMQNDYTTGYAGNADKAFVDFLRFLVNIDRVKIHDLSVEKRKCLCLRVCKTEVDAKDFWNKIEEIRTIVLSNNCCTAKKIYTTNELLEEPEIINRYEMRNVNHTDRHLGSIDAKVVVIMLNNFNKTSDQLENDFDRWIYALKDSRMSTTGKDKIDPFRSIPDIKKTAGDSYALRQFYTELNTRNIGKDILNEYVKQIRETNDRLDHMFIEGKTEGKAEGKIEGKIEGKAEGKAEEKFRMARAMLSDNKSDEFILKYSQITEEQLAELKKE
jgi:hypothetical protein